MSFEGTAVAMLTPFTSDNQIDEEGFRENIDFLIEKGVDGLLVAGTTGESATLTHEEHRKLVEILIDEANGKVATIAGAGSNSTDEALGLTKFSEDAGADFVLVITPYYNKPQQHGLVEHYKYINDKFGHLAGDEILKMIAYTMRSQIGDYDILGRFGGDEFYLFTEITDKEKLQEYITNIQNAVENIIYEEDENMLFGFSGGVVTASEKDFASFDDIVRLADNRLYEAKKHTKKEQGISLESVIVGI